MRGLQSYNLSIAKLQQAPNTSPGFGMGACHHGGSRLFNALCKRNLLLESGRVLRSPHLFLIITAASDACEFRSPTSSRGDNGVVGLTPWHSVRAPLRSHVPLAGRVMSAVYPPSEFGRHLRKSLSPIIRPVIATACEHSTVEPEIRPAGANPSTVCIEARLKRQAVETSLNRRDSRERPALMPGVAELDAGRETREQIPVLVVAGSQIAKLVERDSGYYQLRQVGKPSRAGSTPASRLNPPSCGASIGGVPRFMGGL
jgi:hypothetical protein